MDIKAAFDKILLEKEQSNNKKENIQMDEGLNKMTAWVCYYPALRWIKYKKCSLITVIDVKMWQTANGIKNNWFPVDLDAVDRNFFIIWENSS